MPKLGLNAVFILTTLTIINSYSFDSTKTVKLNSSIVTGSKTQKNLFKVPRNIIIIDNQTIKNTPATSIADLLESIAGINVTQRGTGDVQSDISIRGGNFEQTLIMIDGVKMSNPQTGHHNSDIPISLSDIERIEILKGSASRLYGPNASSGVINIITKKNVNTHITLSPEIGKYALRGINVNGAFTISQTSHIATISKYLSNGHRENTDYDNLKTYYKGRFNWNLGDASVSIAYSNKDFGANGFYFAGINQREKTESILVTGQSNINYKALLFKPIISVNHHYDEFDYDCTKENIPNKNTTNSISAEIPIIINSSAGITSVTADFGYEDISGNSLGNHDRNHIGLILEHSFKLYDNFTFSPGASIYNYSKWGTKFWPGFDIGYRPVSWLHIFGTSGISFRIPSYTELYYMYPGKLEASPDLVPEETISYEAGIKYSTNFLNGTLSGYLNEGLNIIDWVRSDDSKPWVTMNHSHIKSYGIDFDAFLSITKLIKKSPVYSINIGYSWLNMSKYDSDLLSKYVLNYLKNKAYLSVNHKIAWKFNNQAQIRIEEHNNEQTSVILDSKIYLTLPGVNLYVKFTNILNQEHYDVITAPLPGRSINAGFNATLKKREHHK